MSVEEIDLMSTVCYVFTAAVLVFTLVLFLQTVHGSKRNDKIEPPDRRKHLKIKLTGSCKLPLNILFADLEGA